MGEYSPTHLSIILKIVETHEHRRFRYQMTGKINTCKFNVGEGIEVPSNSIHTYLNHYSNYPNAARGGLAIKCGLSPLRHHQCAGHGRHRMLRDFKVSSYRCRNANENNNVKHCREVQAS